MQAHLFPRNPSLIMDLMICGMCGAQHDTRAIKSCKVCDDPRQYVPPDG